MNKLIQDQRFDDKFGTMDIVGHIVEAGGYPRQIEITKTIKQHLADEIALSVKEEVDKCKQNTGRELFETYNEGWNDALANIEGIHKREIKKAVKQERERIKDFVKEYVVKNYQMGLPEYNGIEQITPELSYLIAMNDVNEEFGDSIIRLLKQEREL